MKTSARLVPNPDVIHTELETGQAVLLHMETHKYYSLNHTGLLVWTLLSKGETLSSISDHIAQEYGIQPEQAKSDVSQLVDELTAAGLVLRKDQ